MQESSSALLYRIYNSLFLSLPFAGIEETGEHLPIFGRLCDEGFKNGKAPTDIVAYFWDEYFEHASEEQRFALLFYFIQYVERQVVLFDSVEDALFEETNEMNGPGSLRHLINRLGQAERARLLEKITEYNVRLVLTAHPTQFYPGKVLGIINDLGQEIKNRNTEQIRLLLLQLGKTAFVNRQKPTPLDEAASLGWYLENVFYDTLPDILYRLLETLNQDVVTFKNPHLLELGFWPGGDRDGNPNVKAATTLDVARRLRESLLRCYYRDIRQLRRKLTFRGVEEIILEVERKVNNTLYYPHEEHYHSCREIIDDLLRARKALAEDDPDNYFMEFLDRFLLKVRVFGFHFAPLDIRQDSRKHSETWDAILAHWSETFSFFSVEDFKNADENVKMERILTSKYPLDENNFSDEFVKETIRSFRAISEIQQQNGERGCHRYIISNCGSALNVAEVLALAQMTMLNARTAPANTLQSVPLDIVPLFETIDDLADCGAVMHKLYTNPHYRRHLEGRGMSQTIMLGFSDGTKDGGYLRANWSIYRAKEELTRISREQGVKVTFFDGRGGPPGRGGGNNASYYAAQGDEIESHAIQVTIQGQTVSSTYGTHAAARFNIERLLTAGLENPIFGTHRNELDADDRKLMDKLADAAYEAYLQLKNHEDFVPYLEKMTPLKWYGDSNIASRPTKRSGEGGMKFEDLRAIPFVGAWGLMKQNIPGFYGFGSALANFKGRQFAGLARLYQNSLFVRTLVENSMQSLRKSNFAATQYLKNHPQFGDFWQLLFDEAVRTESLLIQLSGQPELLSANTRSRESIVQRERIVLPLIAIQQFALQALQNPDLSEAQREAYRKMVLRTMFGIINAARNAA